MANNLEFILKLTDQLTPALRRAESIANSSAAHIQRQFENIGVGGRHMAASVDELRSRLDAINKVRFSTTIKREFDESSRAARSLEAQISRLEGRGAGSGGGMIAGLAGGLGAGALIKSALGAAATREQQQVSFNVMTGSPEAGKKMLDDIVKMGAKTPFESGDLIQAAQTMKLFGIENKNIMPNLQMLGDVAGNNAEKLQSLSLAYSQVQSTGRLQGQDLLQLINAGFNPLLIISQKTGMSMKDLKEKMEKGAISADMVTKAFQIATGPGGQFYKMMEQQSLTLAGRWSTFMDGAKEKILAFGNAIKPIASVLLDFSSALVAGEGPAVAIAVAVGALTAAIWGGTIATNALSIGTTILNAVMAANPIGLWIAGFALLAGWVMYAWNKFGWFRGAVLGVWEALKAFGTMLKDYVIDRITGMIKGLTGIGETLYYFFTGSWKKAWDTGKQAVGDLVGVDAVKHALNNGKKIGTAFTTGYKEGQSQIAAKEAAKASGAKGVDPTTANAASISKEDFKGLGESTSKAKHKADSVNSGGQRSVVINIGKQIEKLEIHVADAKSSVQEIESAVRESLRRVLYSMNEVAS